ncbi:MAG: acyl carrier protein [Desulfovibrio sp.]|nr:acyl carrier protein [Desulfovibrio sp.]
MNKELFKEKLKLMLIKELHLEELTPSDIKDETPLFGHEGLGLDSIDTVELVMLLDRDFGVSVPDVETGKKAFQNLSTLLDYILEQKQEAKA